VTVVVGVDEAAQLELYSVADWQPMQLDEGHIYSSIAEHRLSLMPLSL